MSDDIVEWLLEEAEFNQRRLGEAAAEIKRLRAALTASEQERCKMAEWALDATEEGLKNGAVEIDRLQAEVGRLRAENEQLSDHWDDIAHERNDLKIEIERLQEELDKSHRLLSQSIQWQRDAEITKAKQAAEIERLRLALDLTEGELKNSQIEIDRLQADGADLREMIKAWQSKADHRADEVARLQASNRELVEALEAITEIEAVAEWNKFPSLEEAIEIARAATAKAERKP